MRLLLRIKHFYPRPPGGGRLGCFHKHLINHQIFLSTPSGWRATGITAGNHGRLVIFLSTPSGWRATTQGSTLTRRSHNFYPRPPGGGRPFNNELYAGFLPISIHALRVEGDIRTLGVHAATASYFYPRPPGGGRQQKRTKFSSVFAQKGEEFASLRRGKRKFAGGVLKRTNFGF